METADIFQIVRLNEIENYDRVKGSIDIHISDEDNQNLLHEAVIANSIDISKDLIAKGIDINAQDNKGFTPLHYAAMHKRTELAKIILENGGDVNVTDEHGNNALWTAIFNAKGDYRIVKMYLDASGDSNHKNKYGKSALDFSNQIKDQALIDMIKKQT